MCLCTSRFQFYKLYIWCPHSKPRITRLSHANVNCASTQWIPLLLFSNSPFHLPVSHGLSFCLGIWSASLGNNCWHAKANIAHGAPLIVFIFLLYRPGSALPLWMIRVQPPSRTLSPPPTLSQRLTHASLTIISPRVFPLPIYSFSPHRQFI